MEVSVGIDGDNLILFVKDDVGAFDTVFRKKEMLIQAKLKSRY